MVDTLKIRIPNVHLENISTDEQLKAFIKINDDGAVQDYNIISSVNLDNVPSNETKIFFNYNVNLNYLDVMLSLPKFKYFSHIHLFNDYLPALQVLKKYLNNAFKFNFIDVDFWQVMRLDLCQSYDLKSDLLVKTTLSALNKVANSIRINGNKRPDLYEFGHKFTSRNYVGVKWYSKSEEFKKNDTRKITNLVKDKILTDKDFNFLSEKSKGVLRFEIEIKVKAIEDKLKNQGLLNKIFTDCNNFYVSENIEIVKEKIKQNKFGLAFSPTDPILLKNLELNYIIQKDLLDNLSSEKSKYLNYFRFIDGFKKYGIEYKTFSFYVERFKKWEDKILIKDLSTDFFKKQLSFYLNQYVGEKKSFLPDVPSSILNILLDKYGSTKALKLFGFRQNVITLGKSEMYKMGIPRSTFFNNMKSLKNAGVGEMFFSKDDLANSISKYLFSDSDLKLLSKSYEKLKGDEQKRYSFLNLFLSEFDIAFTSFRGGSFSFSSENINSLNVYLKELKNDEFGENILEVFSSFSSVLEGFSSVDLSINSKDIININDEIFKTYSSTLNRFSYLLENVQKNHNSGKYLLNDKKQTENNKNKVFLKKLKDITQY